MRINQNLFLALSSCLFLLSSQGQTVEPDALTRADAVQQALSQNKMILLIISDTNNCTGCISLEFGTLPSTNKPPMRQFLEESFVYWACGPEQNCTEYRTYTGSGTLPLPTFFIIDPHNPQTYTTFGSGDADPLIFYNWLRTGLLKSTKPVVITPGPNETFPDKNIVVQGRSVSTNVTIRGVYYKLNAGAWTYVNASDMINWQIPLDPAQVADSNVLQVYALDFSQNKSQTNAVTFFYSQGKTPATVTLGGLSYIYDGTAKTATAMTVPAGLTVNFTYNGSATAPINAGSYTVIGTINDSTYQGSATSTLVISKATAAVSLTNLQQPFDNLPKSVTVTTTPPNLSVTITYNASTTPPTTSGSYSVMATVNDLNYQGSATGSLVIGPPAPTPVISSLDTNQVKPGGATFFLTVNGSDFLTNAIVRWNGIEQVTKFISANSLRATIEENLIANPGTAIITVVNPGLGGSVPSLGSLVLTIADTVTPPTMTLGRTNNIITIGWPTSGFNLQSSPLLPATNWQDVPGSETNNSVSVTIGATNQFYRLKQ